MAIEMTQRTRPERVVHHTVSGALVILLVLALAFAGALVYPWDPITKLSIRVIEPAVVGAPLTVEIDYCKARAWAPTDVRWSLVNEVTIVLPSTRMSMPVGCHTKRLVVPTSTHMAPGRYALQEELLYTMWTGRSFEYVRQSPSFYLWPEQGQ